MHPHAGKMAYFDRLDAVLYQEDEDTTEMRDDWCFSAFKASIGSKLLNLLTVSLIPRI